MGGCLSLFSSLKDTLRNVLLLKLCYINFNDASLKIGIGYIPLFSTAVGLTVVDELIYGLWLSQGSWTCCAQESFGWLYFWLMFKSNDLLRFTVLSEALRVIGKWIGTALLLTNQNGFVSKWKWQLWLSGFTDNTCHYKLTKTTKTELKVRLRWWPGNIEEKPRQRWADAPSSESGDKVPTASWDEEVEEWEVACQPAGKRRWRNEKLPAKLLFSPATQR